MKPSEIGQAYDQITHMWQSETFDRQNGMAAHRKAISFVKQRGKALDIGCGCTGRFIDLLQESGFTPAGLDVSEKMVALARQKNPEIDFHHGDICQYPLTEKYDFITAWDSIWHILLEEQKSVITKIVNALNSGGVFIFSFGGTEKAGDHENDFMGPKVYYSSLGTNGFLQLFIELGCVIRHLEFDQFPEVHTFLVIEKS